MAQLALTNALSSAIRPYVKAKAVDQVYGNVRLWNYLEKYPGVHEKVGGDLECHIRILYKRLDRAKFIATPDEPVNIAPYDVVRTMSFDWTEEILAVTLTDLTDFIPTRGAGDQEIVNKAQGQVDVALPDMAYKLGNLLYTGGSVAGEPIGWNTIIAASGTYGSLSRTTYPVLNATVTPVGGATTLAQLHSNTLSATFGNREPDIYVTTKSLFTSFVSVVQEAYRYTASEVTDGGDRSGKGRPAIILGRHMIWDDPVTAGDVLGMNLTGFKIQVHRDYNMSTEDFIQDPRTPQVYTMPVKWAGRFAHEEPRCNFKLTGVTGVT